MNFEILTSSYFDAEAKRLLKRYRSLADDLEVFQAELLKNPFQGTELCPGIRKIRMAIGSKGRGRSGGARVITLTYIVSPEKGTIILLLIYDKADASNIKINVVRQIVKDEFGLHLDNLQKTGSLQPAAFHDQEAPLPDDIV